MVAAPMKTNRYSLFLVYIVEAVVGSNNAFVPRRATSCHATVGSQTETLFRVASRVEVRKLPG